MANIQNFFNENGTLTDNSGSIITISPEGTHVEQHVTQPIQVQPSSSASAATDANALTQSPVWLNPKLGNKLDIIRVLNVLYELGMFRAQEEGRRLTKKEFFLTMGQALNTDFSDYDKNLARATTDSTSLEKHLRIFQQMEQKMKDIWNSK